MIQVFGFLFIGIFLSVVGELLLKHGVNGVGRALELWPLPELIGSLWSVFTNVFVLAGFACVFSASIFWLAVLSRAEISLVYPMLSISYVVVVVLSYFIFRENVTLLRLAGCFVIIGGVAMIGLSYRT